MKNSLFAVALFVVFSAPGFSEVILAPQWSEFCPVSFLTVDSTVKSKDKKYWYQRRVQFEESVARCNSYRGDDLKECYALVREAEQNKNKIWDTKVQQDYAALDRSWERSNQINKYNLIRDVVNTIAK